MVDGAVITAAGPYGAVTAGLCLAADGAIETPGVGAVCPVAPREAIFFREPLKIDFYTNP